MPKQTLRHIEKWDEKELYRHQMVDLLFEKLSEQPDNGTCQFNIMMDALTEWKNFDDYWFNKQQKLNLKEAKEKVLNLKEAKEKSVDKVRERAAKQKERKEEHQKKFETMEEMRDAFKLISNDNSNSQKRGYNFEKFLTKMVRFYGLKVTEGFRITGTQIDGSLKYEGENYNIEAKWHNRQLSDEPLFAFCAKQEINMYGRGIFISVNGITEGAVKILTMSSIKKTIVIDGEDIALVLNEMITFPEMLDKKIRAAQTQGKFYIHPITGIEKIKI